jgi:hypothetical protein
VWVVHLLQHVHLSPAKTAPQRPQQHKVSVFLSQPL